jgi:hypothetical protein
MRFKYLMIIHQFYQILYFLFIMFHHQHYFIIKIEVINLMVAEQKNFLTKNLLSAH